MTTLQPPSLTSETLVKALKAPHDPPSHCGPSKIDLATLAWENERLFVPRKSELLLEWCLEHVAKAAGKGEKDKPDGGKEKESSRHDPLLDVRYWSLMTSILQRAGVSATNSDPQSFTAEMPSTSFTSVVAAASFSTLLSKSPILPIFNRFLSSQPSSAALLSTASLSFKILLPLATPKVPSSDILNDSLCAALQCLSRLPFAGEEAERGTKCMEAVVEELWSKMLGDWFETWLEAVRKGQGAAGAEKKRHRHFLESGLAAWLSSVLKLDSLVNTSQRGAPVPEHLVRLRQRVVEVGNECLFSFEIVTQFVRRGEEDRDELLAALFDKLARDDEASGKSVLRCLPLLFKLHIFSLRRHRAALFSTSATSSAGHRSDPAADLRLQVHRFFASSSELFLRDHHSDAVMKMCKAEARKKMVEVVEEEKVFALGSTGRDEQEWKDSLRKVAVRCVEEMESDDKEQGALAAHCITCLDVLLSLHHETVIEALGPRILVRLASLPLSQPATPSAHRFLTSLSTYFAQTRDLPSFYALLSMSLCVALRDPTNTIEDIRRGVLLSNEFTSCLRRLFRDFLTPMQVLPLLEGAREAAGKLWEPTLDGESRPRKRLKQDGQIDNLKTDSPDGPPMWTDLFARWALLEILFLSIPIRTPLRDDINQVAHSICFKDLCALDSEISPDGFFSVKLPHLRPLAKITQVDDSDRSSLSKAIRHVASQALRVQYAIASRGLGVAEYAPGVTAPQRQAEEEDAVSSGVLKANWMQTFAGSALDSLRDVISHAGSHKEWDDSEVVFEVTRALLQHIELERIFTGSPPKMASTILSDIMKNLDTPAPTSSWSGRLVDLRKDNLTLALWYEIATRWWFVFDHIAEPKQLRTISSTVLSMPMSVASSNLHPESRPITPATVAIYIGRDANFYELRRLREALLDLVLEQTASLDELEAFAEGSVSDSSAPMPSKSKKKGAMECKSLTDDSIASATQAFACLARFPAQYITRDRSTPLVLAKRAVWLDVALRRGSSLGVGSADGVAQGQMRYPRSGSALVLLRRFALRMMEGSGVMEYFTSNWALLFGMLDGNQAKSTINQAKEEDASELRAVTLQLFVSCLDTNRSFARSREIPSLIPSLIQQFASSEGRPLQALAKDVEATLHSAQKDIVRRLRLSLRDRAFLLVLEICQESVRLEARKELSSVLRPLVADARAVVKHALSRIDETMSEHASVLLGTGEVLEAVLPLARADRWLNSQENVMICADDLMHQATRLVAPTLAALQRMPKSARGDVKEAVQFARSLLAMLSLVTQGSDTFEPASAFLATSIAFLLATKDDAPTSWPPLLEVLSQASKTATSAVHAHLLNQVIDALTTMAEPSARLVLVRIARVLYCDTPEGTASTIRATLPVFLSRLSLLDGACTALQLEMVTMLQAVCSEKAILLRHVDVDLVWQILTGCLEARRAHEHDDGKRASAMYLAVVSIATSLVRLRRDLVMEMLPHLVSLLSRAVTLLGSVRPSLGAKQTRAVVDRLPGWLAAERPLGVVEARACARLLTTLTAKTTPLPQLAGWAGSGKAKAQSLVKPFSKHAAYVMVAYIRHLAQPLISVPPPVRKELESGLYALCEMMGEHERDAAMVALLDAGGKVLFKMLWREFEKQRYAGRS